MKKEIAEYADKYLISQKVKVEHQCLVGELRPLKIPTWTWDPISKNFIMALPFSTSKKNAIWLTVNRLNKSTYFLPIQDTLGVNKLVELYVKEIVQFYGILTEIVSDRDQRFQARFFW